MAKQTRTALTLILLGAAGGCGAPDAGGDDPGYQGSTALPARLGAIDHDLTMGARGDGVAAVHEYLTAFGYFPSDELARQFPGWRPVVGQGPVERDVFDSRTADALRNLQAKTGLPVTGVVDEQTRAMLREERCGMPEGSASLDPSDKFAYYSSPVYARGTNLKYRVVTTGLPTGVTPQAFQDAARLAFLTWQNEISDESLGVFGLLFSPTSGSANIVVQFGSVPVPGAVGQTTFPFLGVGSTIVTLNSSLSWQPASGRDMQGVLTHEIGHALGNQHSSLAGPPKATMYPSFTIDQMIGERSLELDDRMAISGRYDYYGLGAGSISGAHDVAVGNNGDLWIIGPEAFGDGFRVMKGHFSPCCSWEQSDGGGVRIAVDPMGRPWIVGASTQVYRNNTNAALGGNWAPVAGLATDIGIGANGAVWVVGLNQAVWKFDEWSQGFVPDHNGRAADRVTVSATGTPYILDPAHHFYRYRDRSSDPGTGVWEQLPGQSNDLGIGPGNYLWSIGPLNGGVNLAVWDEQDALNLGSPPAPHVATWNQGSRPCGWGPFASVAVGPRGDPFLVCNGGPNDSISGMVMKNIR